MKKYGPGEIETGALLLGVGVTLLSTYEKKGLGQLMSARFSS